MTRLVGIASRLVGWLLLALLVGVLVAAPVSNPWLGLVIGSGGLLVAVFTVSRLARGGPFSEPLFWVSLLMAGLGLLFAVNRNTALRFLPVAWIATVFAAGALVLSLVGLIRLSGESKVWLGLGVVTALVMVGVVIDGFGAYRPEAVWAVNGEVRLSGTLLVPRGEGPFPLVLFIHGAGAEPGFVARPFADRMARVDIAALSWDKRGTGDSVGGSPRDDFADLASDLVAWVGALQDHPNIDGDRIGLWGSSEGAWIAPLAAEEVDGVSALVLVSPVSSSAKLSTTSWVGGCAMRASQTPRPTGRSNYADGSTSTTEPEKADQMFSPTWRRSGAKPGIRRQWRSGYYQSPKE